MASLKKVTLLVALCYLTTCDESFGLPSQLQQKGKVHLAENDDSCNCHLRSVISFI